MIDVLSKLETITKLLGGGGRQVGGNPGEQWAGGVPRREKKGRDAGSLRWPEAGEKLKKASFRCMLLPTSSQRNEPNNVS